MEGDSAKIVLKHLGHTCISRDLVQLLMPFATGYMVAWNARPTTYLLLLVAKITAVQHQQIEVDLSKVSMTIAITDS